MKQLNVGEQIIVTWQLWYGLVIYTGYLTGYINGAERWIDADGLVFLLVLSLEFETINIHSNGFAGYLLIIHDLNQVTGEK